MQSDMAKDLRGIRKMEEVRRGVELGIMSYVLVGALTVAVFAAGIAYFVVVS